MKYFVTIILALCLFASPSMAASLIDSTGNLGEAATFAGYDISVTQPESVVAKVISAVLSLLGIVFLVLMIYGGFLWMTARGNDQQVDKAKSVITAAIIGVVIIVSAYAITFFVFSQVANQTLK